MTAILLLVGIFILDMSTPVGTPSWILYLIPLFFSRSGPYPHMPLIMAGACTVFIFIAFVVSPPDSTGSSTLIHRTVVIIGIWVAAVMMDRPRVKQRDGPDG